MYYNQNLLNTFYVNGLNITTAYYDSQGNQHPIANSDGTSIGPRGPIGPDLSRIGPDFSRSNSSQGPYSSSKGGDDSKVIDKKNLESVKSFQGSVSATDSECIEIKAFGDIVLSDTTSRHVTSDQGNLIWNGSKGEKATQIIAFGDIDLTSVKCENSTESAQGNVKATDCKLHYVSAWKNIHFINSYAATVKSAQGAVIVTNEEFTRFPYQSIKAQHEVELDTIKAKNVQSFQSSITAKNSFINSASALGSVFLINTVADTLTLEISDEKQGEIVLSEGSEVKHLIIRQQQIPFKNEPKVYASRCLVLGDRKNGWQEGDDFHKNGGVFSGTHANGAIGAADGVRCKIVDGKYIPLDQLQTPSSTLKVVIKGGEFKGTFKFYDLKNQECHGEIIFQPT